MGCAVDSCYSTVPSAITVTYTTTEDGSALIITTTSVTTPALQTGTASSTGDGGVLKVFPTTAAKEKATSSAGSSSGSAGLSKGAIGGIVAAAAVLLIAVLTATFIIIRRLRLTEQAVQSRRETTSGTRTRQTAERKSEVNVRVQPTPSEVDVFDYDPLMMDSSVASPQRPRRPRASNGRSRADSDEVASQPSVWSGPEAGMRWNTPSIASDPDENVTRFEIPPRARDQAARNSINSTASTSQFTYHNFAYHAPGHGRNYSNASELSTGSDENGSQHGPGSPLMPGHAFELGVDGAFTPELPGGSETETESNGGRRSPPRREGRRRGSTDPSVNNIVSPVSTTAGRPPLTHASRGRRRGESLVSPMEGQPGVGGAGGAGGSQLGSIDESVLGTDSLHGHYGPVVTGPVGVTTIDMGDSPTVPGFVSLGPGGLSHERPY